MITRRKFFSFFGTGVALLAKPDLLLPARNIVAPILDGKLKSLIGFTWIKIEIAGIPSGGYYVPMYRY